MRNKKKSKLVVFAFLSVAFLVGGALFYFNKNDIQIVHPKRGDITEAVYGLGKVKSYKRFEVIIGFISTVKKQYADEGDQVKKGQLLAQLESDQNFRAPFDGTVTMVKTREGETVLPHTPIMRLEDFTDRYIELSLEQEAALRIRKGQVARVSFESIRGKVLIGEVSAIYSRNDEFIANIEVPGLDPSVLPGMTADVTVQIGQIKNALLIPIKAVTDGKVTLRRNGSWKKMQLELGHLDGSFIEVLGKQIGPEDELRIKKGD